MKKWIIIIAVVLGICFIAVHLQAGTWIIGCDDDVASDIKNAIVTVFDYEDNCLKDANDNCTESKNQFAKRKTRDWWKEVVMTVKGNEYDANKIEAIQIIKQHDWADPNNPD